MRVRLPGGVITQDRSFLEILAGGGVSVIGTEKGGKDDAISLSISASGGSSTVINIKDAPYNAVAYLTEQAAAVGTDSTAAIQSALDAANAAGGGGVYVPAGYFRLTSHLNGYANVRFYGAGRGASNIICDDVTDHVYKVSASFSNSFAFNATILKGGRTVTLTSAAGLTVGDQCLVYDSTNTPGGGIGAFGQYCRWITRIAAISGNTITFTERAPFTMAVNPGAVLSVPGGMLRGASVSDLTFKVYQSSYNNVTALRFMGIWYAGVWAGEVERVEFLNFSSNGGSAAPVFFSRTRACRITNCRFEKVADPVARSPTTQASGIFITDSTDTLVTNCYFEKCGFCITLTSTCFTSLLNNNIGAGTDLYTAGIPSDTAGRSIQTACDVYLRIENNNFHDVTYNGAVLHDCSYGVISGNTFSGNRDMAIYIYTWSGTNDNTFSRGNVVSNNVIDGSYAAALGNGMQMSMDDSIVTSNYVSNTQNYGIYIIGVHNQVSMNTVDGYGQANAGLSGIRVDTGGAFNSGKTMLIGNKLLAGVGASVPIWTATSQGLNTIALNNVDRTGSLLHGTDLTTFFATSVV